MKKFAIIAALLLAAPALAGTYPAPEVSGMTVDTPAHGAQILHNLGGVVLESPQKFGAVCNGNSANAAADTAGIAAAMADIIADAATTPDTPGAWSTLDFLGGDCIINSGYTAPASTAGLARVRITNGMIQFADTVTAGSSYFFDLSAMTGPLYNVRFDNLFLNGFNSTNNVLAKGGIKLNLASYAVISESTILGFTEAGINETSANYGQGLRIINDTVQGYIGTGTQYGNTCINLAGGDNYVSNNVIAECAVEASFGGGSNALWNNHIYDYSYPTVPQIVFNTASSNQIENNYIDTVQLVLKGTPSGYNFHSDVITGNKFYAPASNVNAGAPYYTSGVSAILLAPQVANSSVNQEIINDNSFDSDSGFIPNSVGVTTAYGTIAPNGVTGTSIQDNSFYGFQFKSSHPWLDITLSNGTSASTDFAPFIPFGSVNFLKGASVENMFSPVSWWLTKSGTVVTATTSSSTSAIFHVQASINNNTNP